MLRLLLPASLIALMANAAMADCYIWRRASDFNRDESKWECIECQARGHYPAPNKVGAQYCIPERKDSSGRPEYIIGDHVIPLSGFKNGVNSLCGCGAFVY